MSSEQSIAVPLCIAPTLNDLKRKNKDFNCVPSVNSDVVN